MHCMATWQQACAAELLKPPLCHMPLSSGRASLLSMIKRRTCAQMLGCFAHSAFRNGALLAMWCDHQPHLG